MSAAQAQTGFWDPQRAPATLVELLRVRAERESTRLAYGFLEHGETLGPTRTFAELWERVQLIARQLRRCCAPGDRALLLYPQGVDFVDAIFACFLCRVIAVPAYLPGAAQSQSRHTAILYAIASSAQPKVVLTTASAYDGIHAVLARDPRTATLPFLATDQCLDPRGAAAEPGRRPPLDVPELPEPSDPAVLIYTSGSTGDPKGVVVEHRNLVANTGLITNKLHTRPDTPWVSWLPLFHDLGLVVVLFGALRCGASCYLMEPSSFIEKPVRWLRAISRFGAYSSGGPNFAFDMCVRKIAPAQRQGLELSSWRVAFNGAEPVRQETLEQFTKAYSPYGFRGDSFYPCYGMAEATAFISGGEVAAPSISQRFDEQALGQGRAQAAAAGQTGRVLVGCGFGAPRSESEGESDSEIEIVEPQTQTRCPAGQVGEIWVRGASIGPGYYNRPDDTSFGAVLRGEADRPYLRTGDLGFFYQGELYLAGRLKDLIILHGINHYPQDLELSVERTHPAIRRGGCAALALEEEDGERLAIVAEVGLDDRADDGDAAAQLEEILRLIRGALAREHEVLVSCIALVPPRGIPKTTSGKPRRRITREALLAGTLPTLAQWQADRRRLGQEPVWPAAEGRPATGPALQQRLRELAPAEREALLASLVQHEVAAWLGLSVSSVGGEQPLRELGLDSLLAIELRNRLAALTQTSLPTTVLFDHPTPERLAKFILQQLQPDLDGNNNASAAASKPGASQPPGEPYEPYEPIAIVSMACRLPGGVTEPQGYWQLLTDRRDVIGPFPGERWDVEALYDDNPEALGKTYCRHGGFLSGIDQFDPAFFGISPREAQSMDPQQRLLLETAWEALERAGIVPRSLDGSSGGVFVGQMYYDYGGPAQAQPESLDGYGITGRAASISSGRLSYVLGLQGPAITIDTACSSSLLAIHLACQSLRSGECEMALAGGVTVMTLPTPFIEFSRMRGLAKDGRCKSFSAQADGVGWSEGCGILVLKKLKDAQRDGNPILALLRSSAVNQDGRSQGLTAPNGPSQERVIRRALELAGLAAQDIDAVEAHGTGTRLGDPIEAGALAAVFGPGRKPEQPLFLGSVKSNIGHTQAAAGVAGVMKMVLALQHEELPATLHSHSPSPHIDWSRSGLELLQKGRSWKKENRVRRAGVSSFGISGTNVHVILEQAPAAPDEVVTAGAAPPAAPGAEPARSFVPIVLSGRTDAAVRAQLAQLAAQLGSARQAEQPLCDIAFTLATMRTALEQRLALPVASRAELQAALAALSRGETLRSARRGEAGTLRGRTAFLFTGQGAQLPGMGAELYRAWPVFRRAMDDAFAAFDPLLGRPLREVMWAAAGTADAALLHETSYTQPALFTLEWALAALWQSWGVRPELLAGHSLGELTAACVAQVFELAEAARLVATRGKLMQALPAGGAMVAVAASEAELVEAIEPYRQDVSLAAINSPQSVVLSGEATAVLEIAGGLSNRGVRIKLLQVSHAFHSQLMQPMLAEFQQVAETINYRPPRLPLVSNISGALDDGAMTTAAYWVEHVRAAVRFADGLKALQAAGADTFIELGPQGALLGFIPTPQPGMAPVRLASLRSGRSESEAMLEALCEWQVRGGTVDWKGVFPNGGRQVELPTYPWQRQRYWIQTADRSAAPATWEESAALSLLYKVSPQVLATQLCAEAGLSLQEQPLATSLLAALRERGEQLKLTAANRRRFYRPAWHRQPLQAAPGPEGAGTWLILDSELGLGRRLAQGLEAAGARAVLVVCRSSRQSSAAPPAGRDGLAAESLTELHAALSQHRVGGRPLRGVIDLWSAHLAAPPAAAPENSLPLERCQNVLRRVLTILRALAAKDSQGRLPLWLVTQGAVSVGLGDPLADPAQAALWGMGRVLSLEHPELWGGLIDLPPAEPESLLPELLRQLLSASGEDQVALRPTGRYVLRLIRHDFGKLQPEPWRTLGTVLVTGGLGALGLHVARWLARRGVKSLVLTGRRGLATAGAEDAVASLRRLGAQVTVAAVDVSDAPAMRELVAQIDASLPPLTAVVHAAGVAELGPLLTVESESLERVLLPKVQGTLILAELTRDRTLDAFVCFSSVSSVWGAPGFGSYAAANAFLDGWAQAQRAAGRPVLSIAWGPWAGGGMVAPEMLEQMQGYGIAPLQPETALNALALALAEPAAQLVVAEMNWARFRPVYESRVERRLFALLEIPGARAPRADVELRPRLAALNPQVRQMEVEALTAAVVSSVLHVPIAELSTRRPLGEMGLDSAMAMELQTRLGNQLGMTLPATLAFDYPTVAQISEYLLSKLLPAAATPATAQVAAAPQQDDDAAIAVVGMSCRFPGGASSPEALWQLLTSGRDAITEVPRQRWDLDQYYDEDPEAAGKMCSRWGGFVDDMDGFDAGFFAISDREALSLDPQQRFLLEVSWEALERAGIPIHAASGKSGGVFIGIGGSDYGARLTHHREPEQLDAYVATGNVTSIAAGRLAYVLGFTGPAMAVDTACSSSLVAVHLACQSLRQGECELALAGGVNLLLAPESSVVLSRMRALSPDGRCKTFDAAANGYVRSDGCGVLVLRRLADAVKQGQPILAVIRGSAVNQDGRSNGLTAPSGPAQQAVIRRALEQAGIQPAQVGYVEAHGTGTALGDPIEMQALAAALGPGRPPEQPLWVGAIKSNIGHAESAAGVAGMIKAILALQHRTIPANLHFQSPSPHIPWAALPVQVPVVNTPWREEDGKRIAGVSSFGISGTNAHVILAEPPPPAAAAPSPAAPSLQLLLLSAKTPSALCQLARRYAEHLAAHPGLSLIDVAFSAATGRSAMEERLAVLAETTQEAQHKLRQVACDQEVHGAFRSRIAGAGRPKVAFLFTGQGAQYVGMSRELYAALPVFRAALEECADLLTGILPRPLLSLLYPPAGESSPIDETEFTQPALFAVEYALAQVWLSLGIVPVAVLGHSVGELVAACIAGVMSVGDALRLVAERGRLMQSLPQDGAMVSVQAATARVEAAIAPFAAELSIAAYNAPDQVVISGKREAVAAVCSALESEGARTRWLVVSHAFHSPLMEPILQDFERAVAAVPLRRPNLPLVSNLSGRVVSDEVTRVEYFARHLREPVQLVASMQTLRELEVDTFIELGPQPTLLGLAAACLGESAGRWIPSLRKSQADLEVLLAGVGRVWSAGGAVDWRALMPPAGGKQVALPTYPFEHERYFGAAPTRLVSGAGASPAAASPEHFRLAGRTIDMPGEVVHRVLAITPHKPAYLADHTVFGRIVVAGAFHLAVVLAAAAEQFAVRTATLREVLFVQPLIPSGATEVHVVLRPDGEQKYAFTVATAADSEPGSRRRTFREHVRGELILGAEAAPPKLQLAELRSQFTTVVPLAKLTESLQRAQLTLGPQWLLTQELYAEDGAVLAQLRLAAEAEKEAPLHPALIDSAFSSIFGAFSLSLSESESISVVPWMIKELHYYGVAQNTVWCHNRVAREASADDEALSMDLTLFGSSGPPLAAIKGLVVKRARPEAFLRSEGRPLTSLLYEVAWRRIEPAAEASSPTGRGTWLVIVPNNLVGNTLSELLAATGRTVVKVEPGEYFGRLAEHHYQLRPGVAADYTQLLQALVPQPAECEGVVHALSLGVTPPQQTTAVSLEQDFALGTYSALALVQALVQTGWASLPRLWFVTAGAQNLPGDSGPVAFAQAPLWGFGQGVTSEHPELSCTRIDLSAEPSAAELHSLLRELASSGGSGEDQLGLRGGARYAARLTRTAPRNRDEPGAGVSAAFVQPDASYLITGGLGALGLAAAELLAARGARHLVLASRRPPDAAAQQLISRLQQAGTQVVTVAVDIAQEPQAKWLVAGFGRRWPPLRGILHTAAVVVDGMILEQTADKFREALAAKAHGAFNLHALTAKMELSFFVSYSSIAALFGGPGQSTYAAANTFLGALSHHRSRTGLFGMSIDWGGFSESGLAARRKLNERFAGRGLEPFTPAEGQSLLRELLESPRTQVAAVKFEPQTFAKFYLGQKSGGYLDELLPESRTARSGKSSPTGPASPARGPSRRADAAAVRQKLAAAPAAQRHALLSERLVEQASIVMRMPAAKIRLDAPLQEFGMDSLMAVELRNRLDLELGVIVPITLLVKGISLNQIHEYILTQLQAVT